MTPTLAARRSQLDALREGLRLGAFGAGRKESKPDRDEWPWTPVGSKAPGRSYSRPCRIACGVGTLRRRSGSLLLTVFAISPLNGPHPSLLELALIARCPRGYETRGLRPCANRLVFRPVSTTRLPRHRCVPWTTLAAKIGCGS